MFRVPSRLCVRYPFFSRFAIVTRIESCASFSQSSETTSVAAAVPSLYTASMIRRSKRES